MNRKRAKKAEIVNRCSVKVWLSIGSLLLALVLVCPAKAQNYEPALASAADAIAVAIEKAGKERIAVIDFDHIDGQVTALGRFLAEEISANLAERAQAFAVIDRANLQSILSEHALSISGLVNPENAKRLGQIAGVDALVLGTYIDFGETYRLSLKAVATDTAQLVASSRTSLPKTNALVQLAGKPVDQRDLKPHAGGASPGGQTVREAPSTPDTPSDGEPPEGYFYFEDFGGVAKGTIPAGWSGGEGMAVVSKGGKNELTNFEIRNDLYIQTLPIPFPDDYDLEIVLWWEGGENFAVHLGNLNILMNSRGNITIMNSELTLKRKLGKNPFALLIEKRRNVFTFYVDNEEIFVGRYENIEDKFIAFMTRNVRWPTRYFGIQRIAAK